MDPGEIMRMQRKKLGLTQKDIAELLHVSESTVQKYEIGKNRIPSDKIAEIAAILQVSVGELLGVEKKDSQAEVENIPGSNFTCDSNYDEISEIVELLVSENRSKSDAMENTKRVLYFACIYYLCESNRFSDSSVYDGVFRLIESGIVSSYDKRLESDLDVLMEQIEQSGIQQGIVSQAAANYNIFKIAAPDTERNILISCLLDLKLLDNKYHFLGGKHIYE